MKATVDKWISPWIVTSVGWVIPSAVTVGQFRLSLPHVDNLTLQPQTSDRFWDSQKAATKTTQSSHYLDTNILIYTINLGTKSLSASQSQKTLIFLL